MACAHGLIGIVRLYAGVIPVGDRKHRRMVPAIGIEHRYCTVSTAVRAALRSHQGDGAVLCPFFIPLVHQLRQLPAQVAVVHGLGGDGVVDHVAAVIGRLGVPIHIVQPVVIIGILGRLTARHRVDADAHLAAANVGIVKLPQIQRGIDHYGAHGQGGQFIEVHINLPLFGILISCIAKVQVLVMAMIRIGVPLLHKSRIDLPFRVPRIQQQGGVNGHRVGPVRSIHPGRVCLHRQNIPLLCRTGQAVCRGIRSVVGCVKQIWRGN